MEDNPYAGVGASGGNLNTAKSDVNLAGTHTQAVGFAGDSSPGYLAQTENYNGSSWTEVNDLNTARMYLGGQGTYTAAIAVGGEEPGLTGKTELYNGSSWAETGDLNTARYTLGSGTLSYTEGLCVGGWLLPGVAAQVESCDVSR